MISVDPTEDDVLINLRKFMLNVLPSGIDVVRGQVNRVPEVKSPNFVVMTPVRRKRLETNIDSYVDTRFIGSVSGTTLTVTDLSYGSIKPGQTLFGTGVAAGTTIVSGGAGSYVVSKSQTVAEEIMASGVLNVLQPVEITVQLDFHGPDGGDNAHRVSTMIRDEYGVDFFTALNPAIVPFYADDPQQIPFVNAEQQYEDRWILQACLQFNQQVVNIPQQFAEEVVVGLIDVDAVYPP